MSSSVNNKSKTEKELELEVTKDELNYITKKLLVRTSMYDALSVELEALKNIKTSWDEERIKFLKENTLLQDSNEHLRFLKQDVANKVKELESINADLANKLDDADNKVNFLQSRISTYKDEIISLKTLVTDEKFYTQNYEIIITQLRDFQFLANKRKTQLEGNGKTLNQLKINNKNLEKDRRKCELEAERISNIILSKYKPPKKNLKIKLLNFFIPSKRQKARFEALIEKSEYFDEDWYLRQNLDVALSQISAAEHFLKYGYNEGRDPSPFFSCKYYQTVHKDVSKSGINPLLHYLLYGKDEKRKIASNMD